MNGKPKEEPADTPEPVYAELVEELGVDPEEIKDRQPEA